MTEVVKAPEIKVVKAVTPQGNEKARMTRNTPPPAKPAAPIKTPPKVVMGDRADVEKFVEVVKAEEPKVEVKTEEPKLPASVLAEQAAGRAALEKNVKR